MKVLISIFFILTGSLFCIQGVQAQSECTSDSSSLCLLENRFQVEVEWRDEEGNSFTLDDANQSGRGISNKLFDTSGTFSLFNQDNHELLVKVLPGCPVNNRFWVFAATTTNVEYTIRVTDTQTGVMKEYFNPYGNSSVSIADTEAFENCPKASQDSDLKPPVENISNSEIIPTVIQGGETTCVASQTTMCLLNDRFKVTLDWSDFAENTGQGQKNHLSGNSGYFWFFNSENPDVLLNMYDGESVNGKFWFYFSPTTNVEYTITVTDTETGLIRSYFNPLGSFVTVLDNDAFATGQLNGPELPCIDCDEYTKKDLPTSGFWFNPDQPGSGVNVEIKNRTAFGAYYGYTDSGDSVWYTFTATLQDSTLPESMWELEADLLELSGGNSPNNNYQEPTILPAEHSIKITFNHLNHATFSIDDGAQQNIVPLSYGVQHNAFFPQQTLIRTPDLQGVWVFSFRSNVTLNPFNPLAYGLQLPYLLAIESGVLENFEDGTSKVTFTVRTPDGTDPSVTEGSISCETFLDANTIAGPDCYFETTLGFTDQQDSIRYRMPLAGIGINKIFGEASDSHVFKAFRYDFCEYRPDDSSYTCDEF